MKNSSCFLARWGFTYNRNSNTNTHTTVTTLTIMGHGTGSNLEGIVRNKDVSNILNGGVQKIP